MADPVAWIEIETGWKVIASDGAEVGTVAEVAGDRDADIFDGLAVRSGLFGGTRYVPAEQVGTIVDGAVHLTLPQAGTEQLAAYEEPPPEVVVSSEPAGLMTRLGSLIGWKRRS